MLFTPEMEKKREAEQRAKEAQERELRKREKAEEKERRRREYDAQKAAKQEMEKKTKKETVHTRSKSCPFWVGLCQVSLSSGWDAVRIAFMQPRDWEMMGEGEGNLEEF